MKNGVTRQFVKNRWLELRIGASSYLSYAIAFVNLVLLISLKFNATILDYVGLAFLLSTVQIVIGHFHLRIQQSTDVRLQYQWLIDELDKRFEERLKKHDRTG